MQNMTHNIELVKNLEAKSKILRRHSIQMIKAAGKGWIGGSFSEAEIMTSLIFHQMKHDPKNPNWAERDRLVLSKAHCCEIHYAALAEAGYFSKESFFSYGKFGGLLQPHSERTVPGVDYSGGSLGIGLSFAVGQALAAKIDAHKDSTQRTLPRYRVYCIIGDGECNEGQIWEAAMAAAHYRLDNLIAIIDKNEYQSTGPVVEIMNTKSLADKWKSFSWNTLEIDGHEVKQILDALDMADNNFGSPSVIIAHTIKGKGVPSFEGKIHFTNLTEEMYQEAMKALR
jgi:transketolase